MIGVGRVRANTRRLERPRSHLQRRQTPDLHRLRPRERPDMAARSGTLKMSKKPNKTAPRAASRASSRKLPMAATKRPPAPSKHDTPERIAYALEAIALHLSAASSSPDSANAFGSADAFVWHPHGRLAPVPRVSRVDLGLLKGIEQVRDILIENTERFADGLPANNALLWGARDDRERALDRDQSGRSGRGKSLAVGPVRIVARLSSLQPG